MTREEIIEAAKEQIDAFIPGECADIIDFAMEMMRLHNEELASNWIAKHGFDKFEVAAAIRAAKPK